MFMLHKETLEIYLKTNKTSYQWEVKNKWGATGIYGIKNGNKISYCIFLFI
jgi:hypothetical protein